MRRSILLLSSLTLSLLTVFLGFAPLSSVAAEKETIYKVLNPRGYVGDVKLTSLAPRVTDLNNKVVYLVIPSQEYSFPDVLREKVKEVLTKRFPTVKVIDQFKLTPYIADDPKLWDEMAKNGHAFVYGAAQSGTGTFWACMWSAALERKGLPGVVAIYQKMVNTAKMTTETMGVPLRRVTTFKTYPPEKTTDERLKEIADNIVAALTNPLNDSEKSTAMYSPPKPPRYATQGRYNQIQEHFNREGWSDGLPIVPPTEKRVKEMLKVTKHAPDEVVGKSMWPEKWTATVEKVAINGVMAGCKPEYMPVLLAMAEAWSKGVHSNVRSHNSFSHMVVVNGPIRKEIDMNAEVYALGPGNQANATIGRALRLMIINLGGGQIGFNLMGAQGNVSGYTFCFPENEEKSPYEPLSVDLGHKPGESTVTIFSGGWSHVGNYPLDEGFVRFGNAVAHFEWPQGLVVLMTPPAAKAFGKEKGLSKEDLKTRIWENARLPLKELKADNHWGWFIEPNLKGKEVYGQKDLWESNFLTLPDDAMVPVYPRKNVILVVVGSEGMAMVQGWKFAMPSIASVDKWR
jgi:hypothetical protein